MIAMNKPIALLESGFFDKLVRFAALLILVGFARMPAGATWLTLLGVSICAGIGFTMSLFIGSLAWDDPAYASSLRLGAIVGSLALAVAAYILLKSASKR